MIKGSYLATLISIAVFFVLGFTAGLHEIRTDLQVSEQAEYISENQHKIDVLHYNINIDLYPENKSIRGDVEITARKLDNSLERIDLNFYDNYDIEGVWLNGQEASFTLIKTRLTIIDKPAASDTFRLRVVYSGKPRRAGLSAFAFGTVKGKSAVYTINEPTYASSWFPCNDIPSDKAQLTVSISNTPEKTSLSNGRLVSVTEQEGRKTFTWETVYPVSTYLVAVYSSDYENFNDIYISRDGKDTMEVQYYAFTHNAEQAKIDFRGHTEILKVFSELFGEYPFIKEKYGVAEFLWNIGAMENQTITGIGTNFVSGNRFFTDIYVHELAHSWWGNAVGPETWKDIWLNEGFATYSEALYFEVLHGTDALTSTMMGKFDENFQGRLYDPSDLFSPTIYSKGAWVVHMLRWELGDSLFFNVLREYFQQYKYKTASTKDFQTLVETLSGKSLSWFFNQWVLEGDDQINLDYNWEYDEQKKIVRLRTKQVQQYQNYIFSLELEIKTGGGSDKKVIRIDKREAEFELPVLEKPVEVIADPGNRLLANFRERSF
jgi:aminopeptidase N